jgi:hypothetical protein
MTTAWFKGLGGICLALLAALPLAAQDYQALRINEIIADNRSTLPVDFEGGTPDMIEIYNTSDQLIDLQGLALSDTAELPPGPEPATCVSGGSVHIFRNSLSVPRRGSLTIFCDGDCALECVEPHVSFNINSDGDEPISLWGPKKPDGTRDLIDQVYLPPLREDVSFGRYPDGAGPAPVHVDNTFDHFFFTPKPRSSFGRCTSIPGVFCPGGNQKRSCVGSANNPAVNLDPRVSRESHSTNHPAAGEAVDFVARVRDDKTPTPPNIARVEIRYRMRLNNVTSEWQSAAMQYDSDTGLQDDASAGRPLDRWTLWKGSIPGQPAGTRVEFYFEVADAEGLSSTRPLDLCEDGTGPCDPEFGGPGCDEEPFLADRYIPCDLPNTYAVGYSPRDDLGLLVINEIVAQQNHAPNADPKVTGILQDPTSKDLTLCSVFVRPPDLDDDDYFYQTTYCCRQDDSPACGYEDYVELYNSSPTRTIDLSGLWLSDNYFEPRNWKFPAGSAIAPLEHLIIWCDDDGSKCPEPFRDGTQIPEFWECPDPNDPAVKRFHTSFELAAGNDQVFLFDDEAHGFGLIFTARYSDLGENQSASLCPDGNRDGPYAKRQGGTPGVANPSVCPPPPPVIASFENNDGPAGTVFTIHGENLADAELAVTVCGVAAEATAANGGASVEVTAPACSGGGCVAVKVCTSGGCDEVPDGFCYVAGARFRRGDSNNDGSIDISDGVRTLNFLFQGGATPPCREAANFNGDASVDISDASATFNFLFLGGADPKPPFPDCGVDPEDPAGVDCADSFCD